MFYRTFLEPIRLNEDPVPWESMDLSYLRLPRCCMQALAEGLTCTAACKPPLPWRLAACCLPHGLHGRVPVTYTLRACLL